jgi:hypothetical protein
MSESISIVKGNYLSYILKYIYIFVYLYILFFYLTRLKYPSVVDVIFDSFFVVSFFDSLFVILDIRSNQKEGLYVSVFICTHFLLVVLIINFIITHTMYNECAPYFLYHVFFFKKKYIFPFGLTMLTEHCSTATCTCTVYSTHE